MESKKDIGQAFREKLGHLDKKPGDAVWSAIKADLDKNRRKVIPAWLRIWTVAGLFFAAAFFTYPLWKNHVPHVYIKMPEPEEQVMDKGTEGNLNPTGIVNSATAVENGTSGNNESDAATNPDKTSSGNNGTGLGYGESAPSPVTQTNLKERIATDNNVRKTTRSGQQMNIRTDAISESPENENNTVRTQSGIVRTQRRNTQRNSAGNTQNINSSKPVVNNKQNGGIASQKGNDIAVTDNTRNNSRTISSDEDFDGGFIVPMSPAYKSYRNNTSRGIPADTIVKDTLLNDDVADFAKTTDSLRKMTSTGVQDAIKAPVTKPQSESGKSLYVYGFVAPTKYTLADNAGYIDENLNNKSTSSESPLAFGAYIGYNINQKLSVRVGAIKSKVELTTNNVSVSSPDFEGVEYKSSISNESIAGQMLQDPAETLTIRNNFEFIEVPVEITYRLYDAKIGLGVLGGFITRFTTDNTVYASSETGSLEIGEIRSLKEVNNGLSLGGSFNYTIVPNLQLNIEPVFKYFFSKDPFIKQHTYSIQAGLQFNFGLGKQK